MPAGLSALAAASAAAPADGARMLPALLRAPGRGEVEPVPAEADDAPPAAAPAVAPCTATVLDLQSQSLHCIIRRPAYSKSIWPSPGFHLDKMLPKLSHFLLLVAIIEHGFACTLQLHKVQNQLTE